MPHQRRVDEAVRGGPGWGSDEAVQRELLLRTVHRGDVVGCVRTLGIRVNLHRPVTILWHKSVDSDCLRLYPCLKQRRVKLVTHQQLPVFFMCSQKGL